jgi:molecular chaperone HtpG
MLLHGVLDSPDIPLNVSRSYLQSDASVKKISAHITKKVADKLVDMFIKDRPEFEKKWDDISMFVKYGIISDEKFSEKAKEFALLKNTDGKYFTFKEYEEKVKINQTDKDKNVVYLYTTDPGKQHSFVEIAKNRAYDVLVLDGVLDSHFINHLEQKLEKTQLKRVDSDTIDKLIANEDKAASILSKEEEDAVKSVFEKAINNKSMTLAVESLSPEDLPVTVTMSEWMRRMKDMSRTGGGGGMYGFMGNMPDSYNVTINGNHALVQKILKAETEEDKSKLAKQVYDLALLSQNMLTGADLTSFIKRSVELVG